MKKAKKPFKLPNMEEEKSVLKTVRLKVATLNRVKKVADDNDIFLNRLINECIEFALDNLEEDEDKK